METGCQSEHGHQKEKDSPTGQDYVCPDAIQTGGWVIQWFLHPLPPSFLLPSLFSPSFISWLEHSSSIVCRAEINSLIISSPLCFIILHVPPELDAYSCKIISTESHRRDKQVLQLPLRDSSLKPLPEDSAFLLFTGAATPPLKCPGPHAECGCLPGSGW